jgi:hypothetical protein
VVGAFLAGEERDARILVITFDASVHGWAILRTSPDANERRWRHCRFTVRVTLRASRRRPYGLADREVTTRSRESQGRWSGLHRSPRWSR